MQTSSLIGIDVGFYPLKIKKLFIQNIFVPNVFKLINGISVPVGKSNDKYTSAMPYLDIMYLKHQILETIVEELAKDNNPVNKELIKELENIEIEMDAFSDFYNCRKRTIRRFRFFNESNRNECIYVCTRFIRWS